MDRRRFFAIARGSAMECAALVDACRVLGLASPTALDELDADLLSIVRMLSKLALEPIETRTRSRTKTMPFPRTMSGRPSHRARSPTSYGTHRQ